MVVVNVNHFSDISDIRGGHSCQTLSIGVRFLSHGHVECPCCPIRFEDSDPGVGIMAGEAKIQCAADESDISYYSIHLKLRFEHQQVFFHFFRFFLCDLI